MEEQRGRGRPRVHEYEGKKKNFSIRLSGPERSLLEFKHGTVQRAIQHFIAELEIELEKTVGYGASSLPNDYE